MASSVDLSSLWSTTISSAKPALERIERTQPVASAARFRVGMTIEMAGSSCMVTEEILYSVGALRQGHWILVAQVNGTDTDRPACLLPVRPPSCGARILHSWLRCERTWSALGQQWNRSHRSFNPVQSGSVA